MDTDINQLMFNRFFTQTVLTRGIYRCGFCLPRLVYRLGLSAVLGLSIAMLSISTVYAEGIVEDSSAAVNKRPAILTTASGVPQVNISTPSAAGVSLNHYQQFDVGGKGAVLANNRKATQTQIAGWVSANPNMARGEADVIVNQVNSNQPSQLGGYVEVASKRADVIIANPSGITVNGGGFLNANQVTLSTGQTQLQNGQVTGHDIKDGQITISGKGLDVRDSNYTPQIPMVLSVMWRKWLHPTLLNKSGIILRNRKTIIRLLMA